MNKLNFESRISLTRKNEELIKTVEELSSCYAKREEFLLKSPHKHLLAMHTSEICGPGVCVAALFVLAVAAVAVLAIALADVIGYQERMSYAMSDVSIYSNIV